MKNFVALAFMILFFGGLAFAEANIDVQNGMVYLNSKADYEYIQKHFPPEVWKPKFQALLKEEKNWLNTEKLAKEQEGIVSETHRIVEIKDDVTDEVKERYQQEYKQDPNCRLLKLGFKVTDVKDTVAVKIIGEK